jgi:hypothetical protein
MGSRPIPTLAIALLLLTACRPPETGTPRSRSKPKPPAAPRTPIEAARVQKDVEESSDFQKVRKAACPRRVLDRDEQMRPFPAFALLKNLSYATVSDDTSRGVYEKTIELNDSGRAALGPFLEEEAERYVITVARREYVAGREQFDFAPGNPDRLFVEIFWRWKPINRLGEGLDMWTPEGDGPEHHGRATYDRTSAGWNLAELWLDRNNRDYVGGVYR